MRQQHRAVLAAAALAAAGIVVPPRGPARADQIGTSSVDVSIPRLATIQIAGDVSGLLSLNSDGKGESSFDVGAVESTASATTLLLSTNDTWDLSVSRSTDWTSPAGYDKAESDLLVRISNTPTGTILNGADSYLSPDVTDTQILSHPTAVVANLVAIQTKVLLDWEKDVPGTYDMSLTYTLVTHLP